VPVSVDVEDDDVVVRITGWDAVWAFSRGVRIPLAHVRNAAALRRSQLGRRKVLRMGGTAWPGVVKAGRYSWPGWRELWATRWPERMLVITGTPEARYDRVVLEVGDPESDAARIVRAVAKEEPCPPA